MANEASTTTCGPSRRNFLTAGAAGAGLLALQGCGGADSDSQEGRSGERANGGEVELEFWTWSPNIDKVVKMFNEAHKGKIKVNLTQVTSGPNGGYAKMQSALKAGNAPDVALIEYQEVPSFLLSNGLADVTAQAKKYQDRYVDWAWEEAGHGGKTYGVPQSSAPMVLYYRKDLLEELGMAVPKTWQEFADAAKNVNRKDKNRVICNFPVGPKAAGGWFAALAWQAGAKWFGTQGDTWIVNMTDDATMKVASYWEDLARGGLVKTKETNSSASWRDVQDGTVVTYPAASWSSTLIRSNAPKTSGDWRVGQLPHWEGSSTTGNWGGGIWAIMKGTKHPAEAVEFAVWISSKPAALDTFMSNVHSLPAVTDLTEVEAFTDDKDFFQFYGGQNVYQQFLRASKTIDEDWEWSPVTTLTYDSLTKGFSGALSGDGTFADALRSAEADALKALQAKGLKASKG